MSDGRKCPVCGNEETIYDGSGYVCPDCSSQYTDDDVEEE